MGVAVGGSGRGGRGGFLFLFALFFFFGVDGLLHEENAINVDFHLLALWDTEPIYRRILHEVDESHDVVIPLLACPLFGRPCPDLRC